MTLIIILAILFIIAGFMIYGSFMSHRWHRENLGQETITETGHFYFRLFYFNRDDKRIFVPKRTGGGLTINFANPLSIIAALLVVGGLIALIILK